MEEDRFEQILARHQPLLLIPYHRGLLASGCTHPGFERELFYSELLRLMNQTKWHQCGWLVNSRSAVSEGRDAFCFPCTHGYDA